MTRHPGAPPASNPASRDAAAPETPSGSPVTFRNLYPRYAGYTPRRDGGLAAYETVLGRAGFAPVAGIDEAGRGACAGPLVVAAVVLDPASIRRIAGLADSKLLTPQAREDAYAEVLRRAIDWHVVVIGADQIDATGLHVCNVSGMRRAFAGLRYPLYGFDRHKGYVTDEHMAALAEHGPSPVHRYSFVNVTRAAASVSTADVMAPADPAELLDPELLDAADPAAVRGGALVASGISPAGAAAENERRMDS